MKLYQNERGLKMTEKDKRINDLERKVEELEERVAIMSEGKPDVIRCKDCKHKDVGIVCHYSTGGDWFCADGERNETK